MSKGGFFGRYIIVDLDTKTWQVESLPDDIIRDYLGARGIGTKLLYDLQEGKIDPLSPGNHLIIFTGPFNGTNAPGSSRMTFTTKSPLSNTINTSSIGGSFPNALKRTGFDGLVIRGRAEDTTWIEVTPEGVLFHAAEALRGLKTSETEKAIKEELGGKCRVACIGPAGENQVRYAAVVSETRTAGRGGAGTVMGSKKLKAIAVSGKEKVPIADKEAFDATVEKIRADQDENPSVMGMQMNGTAGLVSVVNVMGGLPTKNFQSGTWEEAEEVSGSSIAEHSKVKSFACQSCPVGCGVIAEVKKGRFAGTLVEGPEYETAVMLGPNLYISDRDAVCAANFLCDEYGLDTISTGNVIGFAMECFEKGLLSEKDTDGIPLNWGDSEVVYTLIEKIALKEGFGRRLAEGVARLSADIPGSESFAMHVKGLELAAYDPRAVYGQGLSYAIAPRGGEHGRGGYMIVEFFMPDVDLYTHEGKAARAIGLAEDAGIQDLVGLCTFNMVSIPLIPELANAVMGTEYGDKEVRDITRRVVALERKFNIREGFTRKDDTLPRRLLEEPLPDGMAVGHKVEGLDAMLDDYFAQRGWDREGNPGEI